MVRRLYGDSLDLSNEGNRNEKRSDEGLLVWKRLRLQGRMPVQSMRLQALQLLNGALCTQE